MNTKSLQTVALAVLLLLGGAIGGAQAQPSPRAGIVVVVIWPVAGPVQGGWGQRQGCLAALRSGAKNSKGECRYHMATQGEPSLLS
jgi:hypothetical protein